MLFSKFNTEHHNFPGLQMEALRKMEYTILIYVGKPQRTCSQVPILLSTFSANV